MPSKSLQNDIFSDQVKISPKRQLFFWSIFSKKKIILLRIFQNGSAQVVNIRLTLKIGELSEINIERVVLIIKIKQNINMNTLIVDVAVVFILIMIQKHPKFKHPK
jgi:hypothetical protein